LTHKIKHLEGRVRKLTPNPKIHVREGSLGAEKERGGAWSRSVTGKPNTTGGKNEIDEGGGWSAIRARTAQLLGEFTRKEKLAE